MYRLSTYWAFPLNFGAMDYWNVFLLHIEIILGTDTLNTWFGSGAAVADHVDWFEKTGADPGFFFCLGANCDDAPALHEKIPGGGGRLLIVSTFTLLGRGISSAYMHDRPLHVVTSKYKEKSGGGGVA